LSSTDYEARGYSVFFQLPENSKRKYSIVYSKELAMRLCKYFSDATRPQNTVVYMVF